MDTESSEKPRKIREFRHEKGTIRLLGKHME